MRLVANTSRFSVVASSLYSSSMSTSSPRLDATDPCMTSAFEAASKPGPPVVRMKMSAIASPASVSYTHLTLPTIYSV